MTPLGRKPWEGESRRQARLGRDAPEPGYPLAIDVLPMSFRGEGRAGASRTTPSPAQAEGVFRVVHRPDASARYARRRSSHNHSVAARAACLRRGGAVSACAARAAGDAPVYETVVVATPAVDETPREDRAASASVITQDRTPRAAESVPQLLSEQAGVIVTRLGGMGSTATISLRGSTANQVLVYVDGVPLNTATGGGVDLGAIPIGDVERIEIYRGMSPIAFGASAIGGVVSITTAVPKDNRARARGRRRLVRDLLWRRARLVESRTFSPLRRRPRARPARVTFPTSTPTAPTSTRTRRQGSRPPQQRSASGRRDRRGRCSIFPATGT